MTRDQAIPATVDLLEYVPVTKARKIDEDAGILYDLVCLGPSSANGREYPESTMRQGLHLFEGRQSFVNHARAGAEASVYDLLGIWQECRVESGKVRGNFHYFKSHPLASRLVEAARRPELNSALGFSIRGKGKTEYKSGREVVESLEGISSIDCVASPATVAGVYESRTIRMKRTLRELREQFKHSRPGYVRALNEMAEAGLVSPDAPMDEPPPMDDLPPPEPEVDHEQAILDAAKAVLDDSSLDSKQKMEKIKKLLGILDAPASTSDDSPAEEASEKPAEESIRRELAGYKTRERIRVAADKAGVRLPQELVEVARYDLTDQQIKALVESLRGGATGGRERPRSAAPIHVAGSGRDVSESKVPDGADGKGLARWLQQGGSK